MFLDFYYYDFQLSLSSRECVSKIICGYYMCVTNINKYGLKCISSDSICKYWFVSMVTMVIVDVNSQVLAVIYLSMYYDDEIETLCSSTNFLVQ